MSYGACNACYADGGIVGEVGVVTGQDGMGRGGINYEVASRAGARGRNGPP